MVERYKPPAEKPVKKKIKKKIKRETYFDKPPKKFISSGCTTLDCAAGGGWPLGRIINVVGDRAVGKTLLAIEACSNFNRLYPDGHVWYREAEAAFDEEYAERLGLPKGKVDFGPEGIETIWDTIEVVFRDMEKCIQIATKSGQPGLYIIDSLDALSSTDEMKRDIDKGSYKTDKAKVMSELFRRLVRGLKQANILLIVISQIRDKIGVTFGDKKSRSGGKALDFYATHIFYLSNLGAIKKTIRGNSRQVGVRVRGKFKKNKVSVPFREAEFSIKFFYGIDDAEACVTWLKDTGYITPKEAKKEITTLDKEFKQDFIAYKKHHLALSKEVKDCWNEVENEFLPAHSKYGSS
jgi:recombination protein RecA